MTEYRIVCSGKGRAHRLHVYLRDAKTVEWHREYLERQPWTSECRPFIVEERSVGLWVRSGQQLPERCSDCVAGYVNIVESEERCPTCHGYARLYPPALVERIKKVLVGRWAVQEGYLNETTLAVFETDAIAVLDALNDAETP